MRKIEDITKNSKQVQRIISRLVHFLRVASLRPRAFLKAQTEMLLRVGGLWNTPCCYALALLLRVGAAATRLAPLVIEQCFSHAACISCESLQPMKI